MLIVSRLRNTSRFILHHTKISRIIFLILSLIMIAPGSIAAAGEVNQKPLDIFLQQVEQEAEDTQTVQCSFIQERTLTIFAKPVIFKGQMQLSRPDKLRWENIDPIPSSLVFSGSRGLRCNDDAPPVHFDLQTDPVMKMVAEQIWTWADGNYEKLKNTFTITLAGESTIELIPAESGSHVIKMIRVTFNRETLQPDTVLVLEQGGDSTKIRFFDYELNQPIAEDRFTSCAP